METDNLAAKLKTGRHKLVAKAAILGTLGTIALGSTVAHLVTRHNCSADNYENEIYYSIARMDGLFRYTRLQIAKNRPWVKVDRRTPFRCMDYIDGNYDMQVGHIFVQPAAWEEWGIWKAVFGSDQETPRHLVRTEHYETHKELFDEADVTLAYELMRFDEAFDLLPR